MKITALKSGRFANPIVSLPHIELVEGVEYPVDDAFGKVLIACKWAEEVKAEKPEQKKEAPKPTRKKKSKKDK